MTENEEKPKEKTRLERMEEAGLIGCLDGTGITSENYKDHLYRNPLRVKQKKALEELKEMLLEHYKHQAHGASKEQLIIDLGDMIEKIVEILDER